VSGKYDMSTNNLNEKERIARKLGWESYQDAPDVVQNTIDSKVSADLATGISLRGNQ